MFPFLTEKQRFSGKFYLLQKLFFFHLRELVFSVSCMKKNVVCLIFFFLFLFFLCDCFHRWEKKQLGKILMAKHTWKKKEKVLQLKRKKKKKKKNSDSSGGFFLFFRVQFFSTRKIDFFCSLTFTPEKKRILDLFFLVFSPKKTKKQKANMSPVWKQVCFMFSSLKRCENEKTNVLSSERKHQLYVPPHQSDPAGKNTAGLHCESVQKKKKRRRR